MADEENKKPEALSITLGKKWDVIKTNIINKLFEKLEEIRQYHVTGGESGSGFEEEPATFDTEIAKNNEIIDTTYPNKIKEYITVLEGSKYITFEEDETKFSDQIEIPIKAQTLIQAVNHCQNYIDIINTIAATDANDNPYNSCPSQGAGEYGDGWHTDDFVCKNDSSFGIFFAPECPSDGECNTHL